MYQESERFWGWLQSEQAFYDGVIKGVVISAILAFIILLVATKNVIISFFALKTVAFIVLTMTAIIALKGWQLGVTESISIVMIIGFAVDYVVHLAAHYVHTPTQIRYERATDSISTMGVSIFSGAVTTFGSGVFLFGGKIVFFQKFAIIITATVFFSAMYAFIYSVGPEYKQGNIPQMWRKCSGKCRVKTNKKEKSSLNH